MSNFKSRIATLEKAMTAKTDEPDRWHLIIRRIGQSEAEAVSEYETENGWIGSKEGKIIRRIIASNKGAAK